ncbi:hypothetical protein [Polaromonas sp.]|uniref:hypothetical protein n=1 Tax=Polaromonas sp. TaxID=1869339 RepID=UPI00352A4656
MTNNLEQAKTSRAMAALDTMATTWAMTFDIRRAVKAMMSLPDGEDRLIAFIKQAHCEGLYAGRTSLATQPARADALAVSVPDDLQLRIAPPFVPLGEVPISLTLSEARLLYTMANVSIESGGGDPDYITLRAKALLAKNGSSEKRVEQGAIDKLGAAIERALDEAPVSDVLSVLTGAFVGLTVELVRRQGHDVAEEIKVAGGRQRDITIHAPKELGHG